MFIFIFSVLAIFDKKNLMLFGLFPGMNLVIVCLQNKRESNDMYNDIKNIHVGADVSNTYHIYIMVRKSDRGHNLIPAVV